MFQSSFKKWSFLFKLRLFLGLIFIILILILFYFKIIPNGKIIYKRTWPQAFHSGQGFISSFRPASRLNSDYPQVPKIIIDPVYFSVFTPRRFNSALVSVKYRYKLSSSTPIIELGVLKDKLTASYDLQPLQNNILDYWSSHWKNLTKKSSSSKLLILDRDENYRSSSAFLEDLENNKLKGCSLGPENCLALYNYYLPNEYHLAKNIQLHPLIIKQALRGPHQFYLYLGSSPWYLNFDFSYLHQDPGIDPLTVNIWSGKDLILSKKIIAKPENDKNISKNSEGIEEKSLFFKGNQQKPGLYKVEVKISNDIVIKKIESSSNKLVVINRIWPVSGSGNLKLFTDSRHLRVQTDNPANCQKISFGEKSFNLEKAYRPFNFLVPTTDNLISFEKDDIILEDEGVFAFNREDLFNPGFQQVNKNFFPGKNIKYIIANYQEPQNDSGIKSAQAFFDLRNASRTKGRYTFVISVPGLGNDLENNLDNNFQFKNYLEIKEISISLKGKTLWQKIWK